MEVDQTNIWIPVVSLIVTFLAVVVSCISLAIAHRQMRPAVKVADKQITAPMRQAWINKLRELLAELTSTCTNYRVTGVEAQTSEESKPLLFLLDHILLMLNPKEPKHQRLEDLIQKLVIELQDKNEDKDKFIDLRAEVLDLSRTILKCEWNRIKEPMVPDPRLVWPAWANKLWSKNP